MRRRSGRGNYRRATIHSILDEAMVGHVGVVGDGGQPFVIPVLYARDGERLYLHGSPLSRLLSTLADGVPMCLTVTLIDGLVLARSAFHHSMNYRSVVILGRATPVVDDEEKRRVLDAIVEHVVPGRLPSVRPPNESELRRTLVLSLPIEEASAKIRSGPPVDDEADYAVPCWAGEIPLRLTAAAPIPDPRLAPGIPIPESLTAYARRRPSTD